MPILPWMSPFGGGPDRAGWSIGSDPGCIRSSDDQGRSFHGRKDRLPEPRLRRIRGRVRRPRRRAPTGSLAASIAATAWMSVRPGRDPEPVAARPSRQEPPRTPHRCATRAAPALVPIPQTNPTAKPAPESPAPLPIPSVIIGEPKAATASDFHGANPPPKLPRPPGSPGADPGPAIRTTRPSSSCPSRSPCRCDATPSHRRTRDRAGLGPALPIDG
jgi:hypothetical protein